MVSPRRGTAQPAFLAWCMAIVAMKSSPSAAISAEVGAVFSRPGSGARRSASHISRLSSAIRSTHHANTRFMKRCGGKVKMSTLA
jgi:hypothetical protein